VEGVVSLYDDCRTYRELNGFPWFVEPWDLNLLVVRSGKVGVWDDVVLVACVDEAGREIVQRVRATGDAWEGEWTEPTHPMGAVYVLDQHVPGGLILGEHRGRPALRQRVAFRCVRWAPDGQVPTVKQLEQLGQVAWFEEIRGTHLHNRRDGQAPAKPVRDDSEGCTVSLWYHQHAAMIELVKRQQEVHGTAVVSPTFLQRKDFPGILSRRRVARENW
jgi:hypothetical protein